MKKETKEKISMETYLKKKVHQVEQHWVKNHVRFLVPFSLLEEIRIQYKNDSKDSSVIFFQSNTYEYKIEQIEDDGTCNKYRISIQMEAIGDYWNKMITFFKDFEVVFDLKGSFLTAYPIGRDNEQPIYDAIEIHLLNHEFTKLAKYRSKHFNDFLAMLLIHNVAKESKITTKYSTPHLTVEPNTKRIKLADSDNNKHQILYAFNKQDADALVDEFAPSGEDAKYDEYLQQNKRHIVYFVNTDFENFGNKKVENENAESISIKAFMTNLKISRNNWVKYELAVLYLIYNHNHEYLGWINDPKAYFRCETIINKNAAKKYVQPKDNEYEYISDALFQDALNTLNTTQHLRDSLDYFQFLCAANLVNRKFATILQPLKEKESEEYINVQKKIKGCKIHMFNVFKTWITNRKILPKGIDMSFGNIMKSDLTISEDVTFFINIHINHKKEFQFRFRLKSKDPYQTEIWENFIEIAKENNVRFDGQDSGISLQPIAQTLYKFSYLIKLWRDKK